MAENFWHNDSQDSKLNAPVQALIQECKREEENCLYTSTSFFIWLRFLRIFRAVLWIGAVVASGVAASHILRGDPEYKLLMAGAALLAIILPGISRALHFDTTIKDYASAATALKNLQGEFRRAANVWSHKPFTEFEIDTRNLFEAMNKARKPSLTPPEFSFRLARRKIKKGHYKHDSDER